MNFKIKHEKGITLIALVVTVIILLILAGITLRALTDDFGIIGEAEDARTETQIALEEEIIENATAQALSKNIYGQIEEEDLREAIEDQKGKQEVTVQVIGDDMYRITFEKTGRVYEIDNSGEMIIEEPTADDYFIWSTTATSATIVGLKDIARELQTVVIPSTYQGLPVVSIAKGAYFATYSESYSTGTENTNLRKVKIPKTIESIGQGAFSYCPNLFEIRVDVDNNVYKDIDGVLFSKDGTILMQYPAAKKDENYIIPDGVKNVNQFSFTFTKVKNVVLSGQIEYIGGTYSEVFYGSEFLKATQVTIPKDVVNIDVLSTYLSKLEELQSIQVEDGNMSLKDINGVLFSKDGKILYQYPYGKLDEEYIVPDETEIIYQIAGLRAKNLVKLTMGVNVKEIQERAFYNATKLSTIQLNDGITTIGLRTFGNCKQLTTVNIPESLTSIGDECFYEYKLDSETKEKIEAINEDGLGSGTRAGVSGTPWCRHYYE